MAMNHPCTGILGIELYDFRLRYSDENGVGWVPGGFGCAAAFRAGDDELVAMQMDRMMIHAEIDEAKSNTAAEAHDERRSHWSGDAVHGEPVELHVGGVGDGVVGKNGPLLQDDAEIVVDVRGVRVLRMGDEHAEQADHFLHGTVRVVEKRTRLVNREFVRKSFAGSDGFLADERDPVLLNGHFKPVPLQGSAFG